MFRFLALACLLVAVHGRTTPLGHPKTNRAIFPSEKIVGGAPVKINKVPWQVALESSITEHIYCGGAIISAHYVLTSAHCLEKLESYYIVVRYGTSTLESGGSTVTVASAIQHPNFNYFTYDCDVALLKLDEAIVFSNSARAISLRKTEAVAGETAKVSGWGALSKQNSTFLPSELQRASLPIADWDKCNDAYDGDLTKRMICAGSTSTNACVGDAGGAITVDDQLVGILALANGCSAPSHPAVYSNIAALADFINEYSNGEASWV